MTEQKQQYGRFKHSLLIDRAPNYIKFLKEVYGEGYEPHHLLGSQGQLKMTDYLVVMITRDEHMEAEKHKIKYFFENVHHAVANLILYIKYLEQKLRDKK